MRKRICFLWIVLCFYILLIIRSVLNRILIHSDVDGAIAFVKRQIADLLQNRVDISLLVITKAMSKSPDDESYVNKQAHVELARRLAIRDKATAPSVGDRVPYVIIKGSPNAAVSNLLVIVFLSLSSFLLFCASLFIF